MNHRRDEMQGREALPDYLRYWGKADPALADRPELIQGAPLHLAAFHSIDVATVAEGILRESSVLRRKFARALALNESAVVATVAALCALHDLGKFDARFQAKAADAVRALGRTDEWGSIVGTGHDHGSGGFIAFEDWRIGAQECFEALLGKKNSVSPLLAAVCGHHGFIPLAGAGAGRPVPSAIAKRDSDAQRSYARDVVALYREDGARLPLRARAHSLSVMLLAGLCSVADWIGSQVEYDGAPLFVYESQPAPLRAYRERSRARAERVVRDLSIGRSSARARPFGELFVGRDGRGYEPRDVQKITESLALRQQPALVIVEATMGSGKTEAALSLASKWIAGGVASGLYVGLPTMATANGLLPRVLSTTRRMFAEGETINLRLAHGTARKNDAFQRLLERPLRGRAALAERGDVDETEAEVICARWFLSAKRALLSQIGVGTVDQAMIAALKAKHQFVRLFALSSSVVVIDEVHAYDRYMEVVLERLIEWLGALEVPVVLLSATLPAQRRERLVEAWRRGAAVLGQDGISREPVVDRADRAAAYPLVTVATPQSVETRSGEGTERRSLAVETAVLDPDDADALDREDGEVAALVRAAMNGEMAVWIRNTVNDARLAFDAAVRVARRLGLDPARVSLFHSRFRQTDRDAIERAVLARFGKSGRDTRDGALLIATQVVEQSLDLDFDRMVTDLCPIDLLLQRSGRLWRWESASDAPARPSSARRVLRVLLPPPAALAALRFGGAGYIYDAATLWLTAETLAARDRFELPTDFRTLIEDCYDDGRRAARIASSLLRAALEEAERRLAASLSELEARASTRVLPPLTDESRAIEGNARDDEETVQALTRVGQSTTFLPLWWDHREGVVRTVDDEPREAPTVFDASRRDAWRVLDQLQSQLVRMPAYDWNEVVGPCSALGESAEWEAWSARCAAFLSEMRQRGVVILPMNKRGDRFVCRVEYQRSICELCYSTREGLWIAGRS